MTMLDPEKLNRTIQQIVDRLVLRQYEDLENLTGGKRLNASEIAMGISSYGKELTPLPKGSNPRSVIELEGVCPSKWSVHVDLWTVEEGRSDLTLELTLSDSSRAVYGVEIDNIHVL